MPALSDVTYSHDKTVRVVRDYYRFLAEMYLDESYIVEPPEGGWPDITSENLRELDKTEEVVLLLRHLPYLRRPLNGSSRGAQGAANCHFADWNADIRALKDGEEDAYGLKVCSEGPQYCDNIPSHVVSLTSGWRDNPVFLLDTKLGVIYWSMCSFEIRAFNPPKEPIEDDAFDYAAENEIEWRADSGVWTIPDFFEVLKTQFLALKFCPIDSTEVLWVDKSRSLAVREMGKTLREIYHNHGWPELERYRKRECLDAIQRAVKERDWR